MKSRSTAKQTKEEYGEKYMRFVLLGTGQCGKTTIRKQMRCIYSTGYNEESRLSVVLLIIENIIHGAQDILNGIKNCDDLDKLIEPQSIIAADMINKIDRDIHQFDKDIVESLIVLWNDKRFRKAYVERVKYQLDNSWIIFMEKLKDYPIWGGPGWIPSINDIIRVRARTTGIVEDKIELNNVNYTYYDVGGARSERKKWIHIFDNLSSIVYVADLGCYDERMYEDPSKNRLIESLDLFEELTKSKWFTNARIYLVLSKRDILEQKLWIEGHLLNSTGLFPDAPTDRDVDKAIKWIECKYLEIWKRNRKDELKTFVINSISSVSVQEAFDVILEDMRMYAPATIINKRADRWL